MKVRGMPVSIYEGQGDASEYLCTIVTVEIMCQCER